MSSKPSGRKGTVGLVGFTLSIVGAEALLVGALLFLTDQGDSLMETQSILSEQVLGAAILILVVSLVLSLVAVATARGVRWGLVGAIISVGSVPAVAAIYLVLLLILYP